MFAPVAEPLLAKGTGIDQEIKSCVAFSIYLLRRAVGGSLQMELRLYNHIDLKHRILLASSPMVNLIDI